MSPGRHGDRRAPDDARLGWDLADAASARAAREMARCAAEFAAAVDGDRDDEGRRRRVAAQSRLEARLWPREAVPIDLGMHLDRCATGMLLGSRALTCMSTSFPCVEVHVDVARAVGTLLRELVLVLEADDEGLEREVTIVGERERDRLLIAISGSGVDLSPVPSIDGAEALARARRIARGLDGCVSRGCEEGRMLLGADVDLRIPRHG